MLFAAFVNLWALLRTDRNSLLQITQSMREESSPTSTISLATAFRKQLFCFAGISVEITEYTVLCFVLESHAAMEGASCSYNDPGRGLNTFRRHCPDSGHRILLGAARSTAYSHTWEQGTDLRHRQRPHRRESRAKVAQPSPQQPSKHGLLLHRQIVSPQFRC